MVDEENGPPSPLFSIDRCMHVYFILFEGMNQMLYLLNLSKDILYMFPGRVKTERSIILK